MISYGIYLWHLPISLLGTSFAVATAMTLIDALGGVDAGWQRVLIFHGVQVPMIIGATLLVSAITFFTVEIRFRPNLYRWDTSRYVGSVVAAVARRAR